MKAGISGHQKMPKAAYDFASGAIDDYLHTHDDVIGICSLAAGADQLFAEKIVDSGNRLHVIVPCKDYESTFDFDALKAYQNLLAAAVHVETLTYGAPSEEAFLAAGRRVADLADELLAVWDGQEAQGTGGTADIVEYAHKLGKFVLVIWPEGLRR